MSAIHGRKVHRIRILIADNSRIHTQLLSEALKQDPSLEVASWDLDPAGLIAAVQAQSIDVVAVSSAFTGLGVGALEIVRELRSLRPETKTVVLLDSQKNEDIVSVFRAGARGIFSRDSSLEMFCKCMHKVYEGEIWAEGLALSFAIDALASAPVIRAAGKNGMKLLSKRELQVVQCVVQGLTNREIAKQMNLSQHTIKNYLFHIFDKLGASNRTELLLMTLYQNNNEESTSIRKNPRGD